MDTSQSVVLIVLLGLLPVAASGQVSGKSTGQCNYNDGRGWVQCGDYPAGGAGGSSSSGPSAEQLRQQQMLDTAGQLGAALGAAIGRQLSGEADRDKAQDLNNQAIAAANRGDWHTARALTLQALKLVPDDAVLKGNLAFCDRQLAEADRRAAAQRADQERARQEAERLAAERRAEEIAQHLQGQLKTADGGGGTGNPLGLKLGESEPVVVASAAKPANDNPLGFKLGEEERAELKDAPKQPRAAPVVALGPPGKQDDGYWHVRVTNEDGPTATPRACIVRPNGTLNRLQLQPLKSGESRDFVYDAGTLRKVTTDGSDPCLAVARK